MNLNSLQSSILLETSSQNKYVFDRWAKKFVICHPILFFILSLLEKGLDIEQWIQSQRDDNVVLENIGEVSKEQILYYYKKYLIFKKNGFFSSIDQSPFLNRTVSPDEIKDSLANLRLVTLEATDGCNLQCEYCGFGKYYDNYDKREDKLMSTEMAFGIIDYLVSFWNSSLNRSQGQNIYLGFYGGEALINMEFIKSVVEYARKKTLKFNHFNFSMTTNGILLKKHHEFLISNQFNLLVSLDGNKVNNGYRVFKNGKSSFEEVYDNLKFLQNNYPDYFQKHVSFNAVLHNRNSVADIFHFIKKEFDKIPAIGSLNNSGIAESQQKAFWQTYSNELESLYSSDDYAIIEEEMFIQLSSIQSIASYMHHITDFSFNNYNDLFGTPTNRQSRLPSGTCFPFGKKIFVTVNGKILACEKIGHQFELGKIENGSISMDFEDIAGKYNRWYEKIRDICNHCYNVDQCIQCMFYLNLEKNNPQCHGFMDYGDYSKRIASIVRYIENTPQFYPKIFKKVRFS